MARLEHPEMGTHYEENTMSVEQFKAFRNKVNSDLKLQHELVMERRNGNALGSSSRSLMEIGESMGFHFTADEFFEGMNIGGPDNIDLADDELSDFELDMVQAAGNGVYRLPEGTTSDNGDIGKG